MTHGEEENLDLRQRRTRQSLVKALEELLVERPYQSLSVTDICQRAMVHRTTFYAHFNDKQELLRYLLLGVERRCVDACLRTRRQRTCAVCSLTPGSTPPYPTPTPGSPPGSIPAPCWLCCAGGWTAKNPSPRSVSSPIWSASSPPFDQEDPPWTRKNTRKP